MCVCRCVLYVGNAWHMCQESPLWMMCDWERYKMVTYVTPTFFGFFIMCLSCMPIIQIFDNFQLYVQRFLSFGLVMMSYSWFGNYFFCFNKPHVSPYYLYIYIYIYISFTKKFIYVCEMLDIYVVSPLYNSINFYEWTLTKCTISLFFCFTSDRMMLKIKSLPYLLQKDPVLFGVPILSIVWIFCFIVQ